MGNVINMYDKVTPDKPGTPHHDAYLEAKARLVEEYLAYCRTTRDPEPWPGCFADAEQVNVRFLRAKDVIRARCRHRATIVTRPRIP